MVSNDLHLFILVPTGFYRVFFISWFLLVSNVFGLFTGLHWSLMVYIYRYLLGSTDFYWSHRVSTGLDWFTLVTGFDLSIFVDTVHN